MLNNEEYQKTLVEYLDTLRPVNSKHRGKACCVGCDHSKCMFLDWCDVEPGAATIMFNAFNFNRMLEQWKEQVNEN